MQPIDIIMIYNWNKRNSDYLERVFKKKCLQDTAGEAGTNS